jgi:hypothetical protein
VIDAEGSTAQDVTLPWLGVYVGDNAITTFDELSPLVEKNNDNVAENKMKMVKDENGKDDSDGNNDNNKEDKRRVILDYLKHIRFEKPVNYELNNKIYKHLQKNLQLHSEVNNNENDKKLKLKATADNTLNVIISDPSNGLFMYTMSFSDSEGHQTQVGIIKLQTFFANDIMVFLKNFGKGFHDFYYKLGVSDIIIDVRGNGGGEFQLEEILMDFLFRNTTYPTSAEMDFVKTDLVEQSKGFFGEMIVYRYGSADKVTNFYDFTIPKTFKNLDKTTYTKNYTDRFVFDLEGALGIEILREFGFEISTSPYDPQHVYVLTDGVCYSCCGIFTKTIKDTRSAKVLGIGYNPVYYGQTDLFETGSCPGMLFSSTMVESMLQVPGIEQLVDVTKFPPLFAREGMSVGLTVSEVFRLVMMNFILFLFF